MHQDVVGRADPSVASLDLTEPTAHDVQSRSAPRARRLDLAAFRWLGDGLAVIGAVSLAAILRFELGWFGVAETQPINVRSHVLVANLWIVLFLFSVARNRLYDEDTLFPGGGEYSRVIRASAETIAALSLFVFFTHTFAVSRSWLAMVVVLTATFVIGERMVQRKGLNTLRARGRMRRPIVLVQRNGSEKAKEYLEKVPEFDVCLVTEYGPLMRHLRAGTIRSEAGVRGLAAIAVNGAHFTENELWELVLNAGRNGFDVLLHSPMRSVRRDRLTLREIGGQTIVKIAPPRLSGLQAAQKRVFDVVASSITLVLLSPIFAVIATSVVMTSGWPVFYGQERTGKNGRAFTMWKFRTMARDAEHATGAVWADPDDARRTSVGRFLRRTSLDEIPQFWNVLKGDMSIVGPRPERPIFVEKFSTEIGWYEYRHRIRPGITGLAQASGLRGNTSLDERVESDNRYIEHWSIALDLKILWRTIREVVQGTNAY